MSHRRRSALLLAAFVLVERASHYATRGAFKLHLLHDLGMAESDASIVAGQMTGLAMLAPLVGGAIGSAAGPRIPLVAGAALGTIGQALLAWGGLGLLWPGILLFALGWGLAGPNVFALAGRHLGVRDARSALVFASIALVTNLGSGAGGMLSGARPALLVAAVLSALACAVAALFARAPLEPQAAPHANGPTPKQELVGGLMLLSAFAALLWVDQAGGDLDSLVTLDTWAYGMAVALRPMAALGVGVTLILRLRSAARRGAPAGLARLGAIGLFAAGIGACLEVVLLPSFSGAAIWALGSGVGQALFGPVTLAWIATTRSPRVAPFLLGAAGTAPLVVSTLDGYVGLFGATTPLLLTVGAALVAGGVVLLKDRRFEQAFFPEARSVPIASV